MSVSDKQPHSRQLLQHLTVLITFRTRLFKLTNTMVKLSTGTTCSIVISVTAL